jgi:hypothetical protein
MQSRTTAVLLYGALVLASSAIAAEKVSPRGGPLDAEAPVPAMKYESDLAGYVPFREEKLAAWREVNDEVARAGGHIGLFGGAHGGHAPAKPGSEPARK